MTAAAPRRSPPGDGPSADEGTPTFAEGWEADVFVTVLAAIEAGTFTGAEWTAQLASTTAAAGAAGDPLDGTTAWALWLAALEELCRRTDTIPTALVDERQEAWRRAYERTPHGDPVELHLDERG